MTILTSLKCGVLTISSQSLGREETQALVAAMESHVERVALKNAVTLDIETLTRYSGQGVCKRLTLKYDTADKYRREILAWPNGCGRNITVVEDSTSSIIIRFI